MKNLICVFLVAFLTTTTFAQRSVKTAKAESAVKRMTTELDLTPEQQVKIKTIYETRLADRTSRNAQSREEKVATRTEFNKKVDTTLDAAAKKETLSQLKKEHRKNLKSLLTEEQLAAKKANKKLKKANHKAKQQH